jgi:hypothetical protein
MKSVQIWFFTLALGVASSNLLAQEMKYPPLSEYMMPEDSEIALAKSAAPKSISDRATIKVLTTSGYHVVHDGDNGFVCVVMRGFAAPTFTPASLRTLVYDPKTRAPICFDPQAAKTALPYYELRHKLGMEGKTPDQITALVQAAYKKGDIPKRDSASFAYMWSADQVLGPANHWHPHMMVFIPNYDNSMLGDNELGGHLPFINDDAGTPFAVGVIAVDDKLAIKAKP